MKKVTVAKSAGFCFGVKRAVKTVLDEAKYGERPVFTWGPIIHNEEVVSEMEKMGVRVLDDADADSLPSDGTVIIRSHGVSREIQEKMQTCGARIVDATCPFVKKIHKIVKENSLAGRRIIIIGNPKHPEVIGIRGWTEGPCDVVENTEDLKRLSFRNEERICIVSQTTFNYDKFQELVEIISHLVYDSIVLNTICSATKERQNEASELARNSDAMIVIGSRTSSNTQKLYDICKEACENTYYIQTLDDLVTLHFHSDSRVGITAGASAPNNIIQEVSQYVRGTEF